MRTFKENGFISAALDETVGRIITVNREFEDTTGVSKSHADKHGKVQAAYNKYDGFDVKDYPVNLINVLDLLIEWDKPNPVFQVNVATF
ncbi:MAG: hypothetical protein ACXU98_04395 [Syntrophales bacterium]